MTDAPPPLAASCRLPPDPASASRARRFVSANLVSTSADTIDTAQLLVSEVVTNAVLHARTDVELRLWSKGDRVHVRVTDFDERSLVPRRRDTDAMTGRGLQLVETLAARYGVERFAGGKTVWFELWPASAQTHSAGGWVEEDLLPTGTGADGVQIELGEVPTGLYLAAQRHRDALLRECALHVMVHGDLLGHPAPVLAEAQTLHQLLTATVGRAVFAGRDRLHHAVTATLPAGCAAAAPLLDDVLNAANAAAREGLFLTRPALPEIKAFRSWLLDQVSSQGAGATPQPWASPASAPGETGPAAVDWDLATAGPTAVATVIADDDNRIVAVNEAAGALFGWRPDELVGQRIVTLIPPQWRERHVVGFTNFLLTGESRIVGTAGVQVPALHRLGHTLPVVFRVRMEPAKSGRVLFVAEFVEGGDEAGAAYRLAGAP